MAKSHFFGNGLTMEDANGQQQPVESAPEDPRHVQARMALLQAARADFTRIAKTADDGYSKELHARGDRLSKYLRRQEKSGKSRAELLDPNEFMTGMALGMDDADTARALLQARGAPSDDKTVKEIADNMRLMYRFPYGEGDTLFTSTQSPHAHVADYFSHDPGVCVIVPVSNYYPPELQIAGLTRQQNLDFINGHESWHCKDDRNKFIGLSKEQIEKIDEDDPAKSIGNPDQIAALAIANRQESLADAGSIGDLIRKGADPKIIDGLIDWRRDASEPTHMTIAALQELKARIDKMGVDEFRKMNDDKARAFYNDVTEKAAIGPAATETIISYVTGTEEERKDLRDKAQADTEVSKALDYLKPYKLPPAKDSPEAEAAKKAAGQPKPLTPAEQKIFEQVRAYKAEEMLQDSAFKDAQKITPATLVKAYGEMQEELRRKMDKEPNNPLWQAQAVKLQESFVHVTQSLDYVAANARRGVDIYKVEPSLRTLAADPNAPALPGQPPKQPEALPGRPKIGDAAQRPATAGNGALRSRPTMGM